MNPHSIGNLPAFPGRHEESYQVDGRVVNSGLTRRDWFATHAPISMKEAWSIWTNAKKRPMSQTFGAASEREPFLQWFASLCYEYADAMLKETSNDR